MCASLVIYGPGHNSFTKDENGNDIMVYHVRTEEALEGEKDVNSKELQVLVLYRFTGFIWG